MAVIEPNIILNKKAGSSKPPSKRTMAYFQSGTMAERPATYNKCTKDEYTLYIKNLPEELNEDGIKQVFNHYGKILGLFYRCNATWAYVTYKTYHEAESALKDLDGTPPLYLQVSFAKEKSNNDRVQAKEELPVSQSIPQNTSYANESNMQPLPYAAGRGKPVYPAQRNRSATEVPIHNYTKDDDLLYPYPTDPHTYNPYENAEPYSNTNALWTRGQLTITQDGKRHVSSGRGYTMYQIPEPHPKVQSYINKVYEKRQAGMYEFRRDKIGHAIGKCQKCLKVTKFTCERCHGFYCSRSCQVADWPKHRGQCEAIPDLVSTAASMSLTTNEEQIPARSVSTTNTPLRRPKIASKINEMKNVSAKEMQEMPDLSVENKNEIEPQQNISSDINNIANRPVVIAKSHISENVRSSPRAFEKLRKVNPVTNLLDNQSDSPAKNRSFNTQDVTKVEDDIAFERNTFLPKEKFVKIRIIAKLNSREYSVQKVEDDNDLRTLMLNLQSEADKSQKVQPIFGNIYAAKYEEIWHRVLVTSVKPLKVQYVDYGNEEVLEDDDMRDINESKKIRKLAGKIRFSEKAIAKHKDFTYEEELFVKMLSIDSNKVIDVEMQGENDEPNPPLKNANNIPTTAPATKVLQTEIKPSPINNKSNPVAVVSNVVDMLSVTETGILEVHAELSNNTYCITLLVTRLSHKFESLLSELPVLCENSNISNHSPRVGELICGQREDGDWFRGKILSQETPLKMVIIDEARVMPVVKTLPCPEKFLNIPAFGVVCTLVDTNEKLQTGQQLNFEVRSCVIDHGRNEVVIAISRDSDVLGAIIKPWVPAPEQKGVQYATLKSGSEVFLTAYRSQNLLFVRSLDTPDVEQYHLIMQKVAKCAQTAPTFKAPPVVGEMVIALYADDNYYRAIVTKIEDNKVAISYVDFGNIEATTVDKLRVLSNDLKQFQSCATKIVLKNVPHDVPMTKEANDFLVSLVGREVPLICTFDGVPSKDGVHLKLISGESINEKIIEFLTPSWKSTENDNRCYMLQDLKVANLGKIGDTIDVFVSCVISEAHTYALSPLDEALIMHIFDVMPNLMKKYCESTEYYIPRDSELCLVLVQGAWYRGLCLQRAETPIACSIFLVDSGEILTVEHKNIRLLPKDFLMPEALASICTIVNLVPANSEGELSAKIQERISQLIIINDYVKIKIISCSADGTYDIEVPLVREKLIEEGFLPL